MARDFRVISGGKLGASGANPPAPSEERLRALDPTLGAERPQLQIVARRDGPRVTPLLHHKPRNPHRPGKPGQAAPSGFDPLSEVDHTSLCGIDNHNVKSLFYRLKKPKYQQKIKGMRKKFYIEITSAEATAKRLRELRQAWGYSQAAAADMIEVSRFVWNQWERGLSRPQPHDAKAICHVLKATGDWLYFGEFETLPHETVKRIIDLREKGPAPRRNRRRGEESAPPPLSAPAKKEGA